MNYRNLKKDDIHLDDCPICRAMKKIGIRPQAVDPAGNILITPLHPKQMEALRSAFLEAEKQGGITGGPFFEPEDIGI